MAVTDNRFGPGRGSIFLTGVQCTGQENGLSSCPSTFAQEGCTHAQDAGVICNRPPVFSGR